MNKDALAALIEYKQRLRKAASDRQHGFCFWCERGVKLKAGMLDHIIPKSRGGALVLENVVFSCEPCNNERGDMPAADFLWRSIQRNRRNKARQS